MDIFVLINQDSDFTFLPLLYVQVFSLGSKTQQLELWPLKMTAVPTVL